MAREESFQLVELSAYWPSKPLPDITFLLPFAVPVAALIVLLKVVMALRSGNVAGRDCAGSLISAGLVVPLLTGVAFAICMPLIEFLIRFFPELGLGLEATLLMVKKIAVLLLILIPSTMKCWGSSYTGIGGVGAAQLAIILLLHLLSDASLLEIYSFTLGLTRLETPSYVAALFASFYSRWALPWFVGSMIAITAFAAARLYLRRYHKV